MNYENKYNNLVAAIRRLQEANPSDKGIQSWINDNVPELAENEDERIRKALITFFQEFPYGSMEKAGTNVKEALTWLEKQGQDKESQHEKGNEAMPQYINKSDLIAEIVRRL